LTEVKKKSLCRKEKRGVLAHVLRLSIFESPGILAVDLHGCLKQILKKI
jgi:hypothetical protein